MGSGELKRFGNAGEECGDAAASIRGADSLLALGAGVLVDGECAGRQAEHHDWEEASLVHAWVVAGDAHRVALVGGTLPVAGDIVDAGDVEPEHIVQCVVQAGRDKQTVEEAVDAGADVGQAT